MLNIFLSHADNGHNIDLNLNTALSILWIRTWGCLRTGTGMDCCSYRTEHQLSYWSEDL